MELYWPIACTFGIFDPTAFIKPEMLRVQISESPFWLFCFLTPRSFSYKLLISENTPFGSFHPIKILAMQIFCVSMKISLLCHLFLGNHRLSFRFCFIRKVCSERKENQSRYFTIRFVCPKILWKNRCILLLIHRFITFIHFLRRHLDIYQYFGFLPFHLKWTLWSFQLVLQTIFFSIYYPRHNVSRIIYCCVSLPIGPTSFLCNICLTALTAFFEFPRR